MVYPRRSLFSIFFAKFVFCCAVVAFLVLAGCLAYKAFILYRDVDAVIERSQIAADREDMLDYLGTLKTNMKIHKMDKGHFALVFKTPANDLSLHYQMVVRLMERLDNIKNISKSDAAYQVALSDIRGNLRELKKPALYFFWVKYWYMCFCVLLGAGLLFLKWDLVW